MNRKQRRLTKSRAKLRGGNPPVAITELFEQAIAHHQADRLGAAETIYRKILRIEPHNPDALHLSGVIALQNERYEEAFELIGHAIAENSTMALYRQNMAITLEALDRGGEALIHFIKAAELAPNDPEHHLRLGEAYVRAENPPDAARSFQRVLDTGARNANTYTSLAIALMNSDDAQGAVRNFEQALEHAPHEAFTYANLGRFHADHDNPEEAEQLLRRALEIDPNLYEAVVELGALMTKTYRAQDALPLLKRACALRPDSIRARSEHAAALRTAGYLEQAHAEITAIIQDSPLDHKAHNNLGLVLSRMDRFDEAILVYNKTLELEPEYDSAYSNRALLRLAQGNFAGGWKDYLHRDTLGEMAGTFDRDILPEDLSGKRIALYRDQGLGDEIFFLRFARQLKDRGGKISYNPDPKIAGMIERLDFIDDFIREDWPDESHDLKISLGDLPFLLSFTDAGNIPPPLGISVLSECDDEIAGFLRNIGPPPYIGCTWRAGVQYGDSLSKLSPQSTMADVLQPVNGTVLVLQRNPRPDEISEIADVLGSRVHDASHYNENLEGMLALLSRIDEYVCVSNTNTHLRAARGLTSRVLIPLPPDYRWMQRGDQSPWFPGTPLYRETTETGWDDAFEKLGRDLIEAVGPR